MYGFFYPTVVFQLLCPKSLIYETADEKKNSTKAELVRHQGFVM